MKGTGSSLLKWVDTATAQAMDWRGLLALDLSQMLGVLARRRVDKAGTGVRPVPEPVRPLVSAPDLQFLSQRRPELVPHPAPPVTAHTTTAALSTPRDVKPRPITQPTATPSRHLQSRRPQQFSGGTVQLNQQALLWSLELVKEALDSSALSPSARVRRWLLDCNRFRAADSRDPEPDGQLPGDPQAARLSAPLLCTGSEDFTSLSWYAWQVFATCIVTVLRLWWRYKKSSHACVSYATSRPWVGYA